MASTDSVAGGTEPPRCDTCNTASTNLKKCSRCKTASYCSRECQKSDWKSHKTTCSSPSDPQSQTGASSSSSTSAHLSPPKGLDSGIAKPFTALQNGTWLHNRSEKDTFRLLIDVYRMRVEDMYTFGGDVDEDSIYSGNPGVDGRAGFRRYLKKVERHKNGALLPKWWNEQKREECIAYGGPRGTDAWAKLRHAVEKSDINEHYGDPQMAMQLRMFTEAVDGRGPGGAQGDGMRQMMAMMEARGMKMSSSKIDEKGNIVDC
ncbi:hypothetical protein V8F20_011139 [Naviculisporaceae sp. PSN 640]